MKKIMTLFLVCTLFFSVNVLAQSEAADENVLYTLKGYDIVGEDGYDSGNECVTRGEFAAIVTKLMCISESASEQAQTTYWDVPSDYKYAGDISVLTAIGILNGYSEKMFAPNDYVTYEQAIKVLVDITGYGDIAQKNGGWTEGYVMQARKNKMLSGVSREPFTRMSLYRLVYNTLDVPLIDRVIQRGGSELEKTDDTLRNRIAGEIEYELYRHKGVIVASSYTYTSAPYSDLYDDEVVIENRSVGGSYIYNIGRTNAPDMVGCEVEFYARKSESGYELLSVKTTRDNEVVEVNSEDFEKKNGLEIFYSVNNKNEKLILDDDYRVVVNGSRVISPEDNVFEIADGYITFIDNDSDDAFELAFIWKYQNAVAKSFDGEVIRFANNAQFDNLTALKKDTENDDIKIVITDASGKEIESFDSERVVSVFVNNDRTRFRIIASDEIFEGAVNGMGEDFYTVNDRDYKTSASLGSVRMGDTCKLYVDYQGKLAFAKELGDINYGYIFEYGHSGSGLSSALEAKIIIPGKVDAGIEINEEDTTDTSSVPYLILQNDSVKVIKFAEKVSCDGKKYTKKELVELLDSTEIRVIAYETDEKGEINEIIPLEKCGGDIAKRYQYDVYDKVFGGTTVDQTSGFSLNSDTLAICIPADDNNNINYDASEDDLNVRINITVANNEVGYRVEGYDYNPEVKKARLLITFATMDSTAVQNIDGFSSKASIVTAARNILNEETGDYDLSIDVLQGSAVKTLTPMVLNSENRDIGKLKKGDLITFLTNKNDLMSNAYIMQSIPELTGSSYYENVSGSVKKSFGRVGKIEYDEIDTYNRALVTNIELYTGGSSPRTVSVKQKNTPPVYIYNSAEDKYQAASLKDIIPENDEIFIFERNGDALIRAVVIIR